MLDKVQKAILRVRTAQTRVANGPELIKFLTILSSSVLDHRVTDGRFCSAEEFASLRSHKCAFMDDNLELNMRNLILRKSKCRYVADLGRRGRLGGLGLAHHCCATCDCTVL